MTANTFRRFGRRFFTKATCRTTPNLLRVVRERFSRRADSRSTATFQHRGYNNTLPICGRDCRQTAISRQSRVYSVQTSNFYLGALKSFCRWMVKDRRARENPVAHLDGLNVKLDRRHDRRNLTPVELSKLLTTTAAGPVRHKMTGRSRAMLYRVAMETGLRRKELRTLTPSSFQLEGDELTVAVEAGRSKNRKATLLPIRPELATELRQWFQTAGFGPSDALWPDLTNHTAKMLKADLEACWHRLRR